MKTKHFMTMAALAGAMLMASCNSEDFMETENNTAELQFSGSVGAEISDTRASGASWAENDKIGIFMYKHVTGNQKIPTTPNSYFATNKKYVTPDATKHFTPVSESEKIALTQSSVDFFAYYPWKRDETISGHQFEIEKTQSTENQPKFDYLWACANNNGAGYPKGYSKAVLFQFKHLLTKLEIDLKAGEGIDADLIKNATVKIVSVPYMGVFCPTSGKVSVSSNKNNTATITPRKLETAAASSTSCAPSYVAHHDAILLPKACGEFTSAHLQFIIDGTTYKWNIGNLTFAAGKKYLLSATLNCSGLSVEGCITDWEPGCTEEHKLCPA